jgi:hypothetical protein
MIVAQLPTVPQVSPPAAGPGGRGDGEQGLPGQIGPCLRHVIGSQPPIIGPYRRSMMTLPLIKAPKRQRNLEPAQKRRSRWDAFFANPAAIESDYHRMARRHEERSNGSRP